MCFEGRVISLLQIYTINMLYLALNECWVGLWQPMSRPGYLCLQKYTLRKKNSSLYCTFSSQWNWNVIIQIGAWDEDMGFAVQTIAVSKCTMKSVFLGEQTWHFLCEERSSLMLLCIERTLWECILDHCTFLSINNPNVCGSSSFYYSCLHFLCILDKLHNGITCQRTNFIMLVESSNS